MIGLGLMGVKQKKGEIQTVKRNCQKGADFIYGLFPDGAILIQIRKRLPETKVYLMAYYPVNAEAGKIKGSRMSFERRNNQNLFAANKAIEKLAEKMYYRYIDVNQGLCDEMGRQQGPGQRLVSHVVFRKHPIENFGTAFSNAGFMGIPLAPPPGLMELI